MVNIETQLLTPSLLYAASQAEQARRWHAARRLTTGAWALITDPTVVLQVGARHVQIADGLDGLSNVTIRPFFGTATHQVGRGALSECLALGDRVDLDDCRGVVCSVVPGEDASVAYLLTPLWGADGRDSDTPAITHEVPAGDVSKRRGDTADTRRADDIAKREPTLTSPNGLFVRGYTADVAVRVGPDLSVHDFTRVAAFAEPCQPRKDDAGRPVVEDFQLGDAMAPAVLCDFLGGATLWVWKSVLVDNTILRIPWWDSPSQGHHPALDRIYRPSLAAKSPAIDRASEANASHARALPGFDDIFVTSALPLPQHVARQYPALTGSDIMPTSHPPLHLTHPQRNTVIVVDAIYATRLRSLVDEMRSSLPDETLEDIGDDLIHLKAHANAVSVGAYEVRSVTDLEVGKYGSVTLATCRPSGARGPAQHVVALGLVTIPNHDQLEAPKALARVGQTAARAARSGVVAAKDAIVETGKRKLGTGAKVLAEGSLVSGHEAVRRTAGAALGALTGRDPKEVAEHPVFQQAFNEASTGGMRFAAGLIERFAPGTAKVVRGAADTLEEGIDRKQANKVLDAAAPMVGRGLQALAQAAVSKFLPALAAPAAAPALPPTPTPAAAPDGEADDGDRDGDRDGASPSRKPTRKPRTRKVKSAPRGENGGAA